MPPLYDFRCEGCGHVFEALQAMRPDPAYPVPCPVCPSRLTTRLLGAAPVVLKGAVWARDGYSTAPKKENP